MFSCKAAHTTPLTASYCKSAITAKLKMNHVTSKQVCRHFPLSWIRTGLPSYIVQLYKYLLKLQKIERKDIIQSLLQTTKVFIRRPKCAGRVASLMLIHVTYEPRHEKTNVLISDLVRHKPGCAVTEDDKRLEISDLGSRGIVLSV